MSTCSDPLSSILSLSFFVSRVIAPLALQYYSQRHPSPHHCPSLIHRPGSCKQRRKNHQSWSKSTWRELRLTCLESFTYTTNQSWLPSSLRKPHHPLKSQQAGAHTPSRTTDLLRRNCSTASPEERVLKYPLLPRDTLPVRTLAVR